MNQIIKEIPRLSIDKVISIFNKEEGDAYIPGCLIGKRTSRKKKTSEQYLKHPFSLDAFVIILCNSGSVRITTNTREFSISENDLYINFPSQIMYPHDADNCKVTVTVLDLAFIREMSLDIKPITQKLIDMKNTQCMKLSDNAFNEMLDIEKSLAAEIRNNERDSAFDEILRCLIAALFFKIGRAIDLNVKERSVNKEMFDRNAGYFKEFMLLLGQHFKQERSVGFYADKMHLSPKYFTTLIKRSSGQTAAEWINHYVILEAKNLLKYSTMNVQEIAYSLNFPNQSFFGKYFKHHTGMTPSEYKKCQ